MNMVLNEYLGADSHADNYPWELSLDAVLRKETIGGEGAAVRQWNVRLEAAGKTVGLPGTEEHDNQGEGPDRPTKDSQVHTP